MLEKSVESNCVVTYHHFSESVKSVVGGVEQMFTTSFGTQLCRSISGLFFSFFLIIFSGLFNGTTFLH